MPTPVSPNAAFNNALESRRAHLLSLDAASLRIIRVDPVVIVNASIGAAPRLEKFREELVARFGAEATELLEALRPSALALKQADADFDGISEGNALPPIHQELLAKHAVMLKDAESLVLRGHLPADALTNAREVRGYQATIDSTMVLLSVLRRNWAKIGGITPITEQDLADIEAVALRLTDALATRDQASLRGVAGTSQTWDEARPLIHVVERGTRWAVSMGLELTTAFFSDDLRRLEPDDYVFLGRRAPMKLLELIDAALNDDGDS